MEPGEGCRARSSLLPVRDGPEASIRLPRAVLVRAPRGSHAGTSAAGPVAAMGPLQVPLRSLDRAEPKPQPEVRGRDGRTKGACLQFPDATTAAGREADCLKRTAGLLWAGQGGQGLRWAGTEAAEGFKDPGPEAGGAEAGGVRGELEA